MNVFTVILISDKSLIPGEEWEVLVPAGWGMNVFLPLILHGAVVIGQHEAENLHLEALTSLPSHLLPDTPAWSLYSNWLTAERRKKFFSIPPASRPNYIKLGVQFPFSQPWHKLLQEWQSGISDFFVLRESRLISHLSFLIENTIRKKNVRNEKVSDDSSNENMNGKTAEKTNDSLTSNGNTSVSTDGVNSEKRKADDDLRVKIKRAKQEDLQGKGQQDEFEGIEDLKTCKVFTQETDSTQELASLSPTCLVMVQLVIAHKGTLEPCSMICLPKEEDHLQANELPRPGNPREAPEEPLHQDPKQDHRKRMRDEHIKMLVQL